MRPLILNSSLVAVAGSALILALGVPAISNGQGTSSASTTASHKHSESATSTIALRQGMRKLWEDHVTWTRLVIVSTAANLPDLDPTTQRLLQNQTDIGNAIKPFYGDSAGNKLTELLRTHIVGAADVLAAAKANDQAKVDAA